MACRQKTRVAIIGAGFAGLGAARNLLSKGDVEIRIFEAASKVGGRIKSVCIPGDPTVELGGTFFYFSESTAPDLKDFVEDKGFVVGTVDGGASCDELTETDMPAYRVISDGEKLTNGLVMHYRKIYQKIQREIYERATRGDWEYTIDSRWEKGDPKEASSVTEMDYGAYMARRFQSVLRSEAQCSDPSKAWLIMEHMNSYEAFMSGARDINLVDEFSCYEDPDGHLNLRCSHQDVVDALAKDIPPECLQLKKEVQLIEWTPDTRTGVQSSASTPKPSAAVTVMCTDGTKYSADHVIVTVSLGVLQLRCPSSSPTPLFSPQLPNEKISAITKLGYGNATKVLLKFPSPLLSQPHRSIELFWLEKDYSYPEKYPWASRQFVISREGNSSSYTAIFVGEDALAVENASDTEVAEGMCLVLEKFLQKPVDRPVLIVKATWCTDRFFQGAYSHAPKGHGNSNGNRETLAQPLNGSTPLQVLFAGEATHQTLYSTMYGAYDTGIREANRLLKFYAGSEQNV